MGGWVVSALLLSLFLYSPTHPPTHPPTTGLKKPIRQGQQRYNYLVLQTHDGVSEVTVSMTEEELKVRLPPTHPPNHPPI